MSLLTTPYKPLKDPLPLLIPQNLLGFSKLFNRNFIDLNVIEATFLCPDSSLPIGNIDKIFEDRFTVALTHVANEFIRSFDITGSFMEIHQTALDRTRLYVFTGNSTTEIYIDEWKNRMKFRDALELTRCVCKLIMVHLLICFANNKNSKQQFDLADPCVRQGLCNFFVYMTMGFTLTKQRYVTNFTRYLGQTLKQTMIIMMPYFCIESVTEAIVLDASYFLAATLDVFYDHESYAQVRKDADDRYQRLYSTYKSLVSQVISLPKPEPKVNFEVETLTNCSQENLEKVAFVYGQMGSADNSHPPVIGVSSPNVNQSWGYLDKNYGTQLGTIDQNELGQILDSLVTIANSKVVTPIPAMAVKWMKSAKVEKKEDNSWTLAIRFCFDTSDVQEYVMKSIVPIASSSFYYVLFFEFFQFVLNVFNSGVKYAKLKRLGKAQLPFFVSKISQSKQQAYAYATYYYAIFAMRGLHSYIAADNYLGKIVGDFAARLRYYVHDRSEFSLGVFPIVAASFISRLYPFAVAPVSTIEAAILPFILRRHIVKWIRSFVCWLLFQDVACYISNIDEIFNRYQTKNIRDNVFSNVTEDKLIRLGLTGYLRVPESIDVYKNLYSLIFPISEKELYGDVWMERMRFQRHVLIGESKQCISCSRVLIELNHSTKFADVFEYHKSSYYPPTDFGFPKLNPYMNDPNYKAPKVSAPQDPDVKMTDEPPK